MTCCLWLAGQVDNPEARDTAFTVVPTNPENSPLWATYQGLPPLEAFAGREHISPTAGVWVDGSTASVVDLARHAQSTLAALVNASSTVRVQVLAMLVSNCTGGSIDKDGAAVRPWQLPSASSKCVGGSMLSLSDALLALRSHCVRFRDDPAAESGSGSGSGAGAGAGAPMDGETAASTAHVGGSTFAELVGRVRALLFKWICGECAVKCALRRLSGQVRVEGYVCAMSCMLLRCLRRTILHTMAPDASRRLLVPSTGHTV